MAFCTSATPHANKPVFDEVPKRCLGAYEPTYGAKMIESLDPMLQRNKQ